MGEERARSRVGSGGDGSRARSRSPTRLYVGLFQLLVAAFAFYVGAVDARPLDLVAGVVTAALGIRSFVLYARRRPEESDVGRPLIER